MNDRLYIRLNSDEQSVQWGLLTHEHGAPSFVEQGQLLLADLVALAEQAQNREVAVLIPASRVRCFNVQAPTKNRKQLEKAVPYLLEEQIIESVDTQHFALGTISSDGLVAVNVIDKGYLSNLLEQLQAANIEPDYVVADVTCLPVFDDAWTLLDSDNDSQVLVRQSANDFFASDRMLVADLLQWNMQQQVEAEQSVSQAIRIYSDGNEAISLEGIAGLAIQKMPVDEVFLWLCSQFNQQQINLLQQQYASNKKSQKNYGKWKITAIAASVLLVATIAYVVSNIVILNSKKTELEQQLLSEIQQVKPSVTDVGSGLYHLDSSYQQLGGGAASGNGLMLLMDKSFSAMNNSQLTFTQLEYLSDRAQLSFDVEAQSYTALTSAQSQLEQVGLKVDMRNASDSNGVWSARMSIKVN
ncbi:MAG: general secretion pathway protein GspL [Kangiellaceae bacterium]|nr:general secretion pathway protein GspL [Kangiellaceae bacterium]